MSQEEQLIMSALEDAFDSDVLARSSERQGRELTWRW
jgi:hypothetical protein